MYTAWLSGHNTDICYTIKYLKIMRSKIDYNFTNKFSIDFNGFIVCH